MELLYRFQFIKGHAWLKVPPLNLLAAGTPQNLSSLADTIELVVPAQHQNAAAAAAAAVARHDVEEQ